MLWLEVDVDVPVSSKLVGCWVGLSSATSSQGSAVEEAMLLSLLKAAQMRSRDRRAWQVRKVSYAEASSVPNSFSNPLWWVEMGEDAANGYDKGLVVQRAWGPGERAAKQISASTVFETVCRTHSDDGLGSVLDVYAGGNVASLTSKASHFTARSGSDNRLAAP